MVAPKRPSTIVIVIGRSITPAGADALCDRVRALLENDTVDRLICEVGALTDPDAGTLDALARMALTARRLGRSIRLRHARPELQGLVALLGLEDAMGLGAELRFEPRGQAEEREEPRRVEEERHPGDPSG